MSDQGWNQDGPHDGGGHALNPDPYAPADAPGTGDRVEIAPGDIQVSYTEEHLPPADRPEEVGPAGDAPEPPARPRRFPRLGASLGRLSFGRSGRGVADLGEAELAEAGVDARRPEADPGDVVAVGDEALPRSRWARFPLARAKRETRVGVAALVSFLILVTALVLNRSTKGKAGASSAPEVDAVAASKSSTPDKPLLALNGPKLKDDEPERPSADPNAPPDGPTLPTALREDAKADPLLLARADTSPPISPEPLADAGPTPPAVPESKPDPKPDPGPVLPDLPVADEPIPTAPKAPSPESMPPDSPTPKPKSETPAAPAPVLPDLQDTLPAPAPSPDATPPPEAKIGINPAPKVEEKLAPAPAPVKDDLPGSQPRLGAAEPKGTTPKPAQPPPTPAPELIPVPVPTPTSEPARPAGTPSPESAKTPPMPVEPATAEPPKVPEPSTPSPARPDGGPTPVDRVPPFSPTPIRPEPSPTPDRSTPEPKPGETSGNDEPPPRAGTIPRLSATPSEIESEPAQAGEVPPSAPRGTPSAGVATIRNRGRGPLLDDAVPSRPAAQPAIPDAPMPREEPGSRDRVEPILHTVRSGENFWTISRLYYGSGRYYKSLHAANRRLSPDIRSLYVGTTLSVPPVEELDPTLFEAPARPGAKATAEAPSPAPESRSSRGADVARRVPTLRRSEVELGLPARGGPRSRDLDVEPVSKPTYKVRSHDTLRSIARDALGDSRRYREILEMNRDLIDDPARLVTGQILNLPEDATPGRRLR